MNKRELIKKRFQELLTSGNNIKIIRSSYDEDEYVDAQSWQKWSTSVLSLLIQVFGETSVHYKNFKEVYSKESSSTWYLNEARGIFLSAIEDYDGGYLFNIESVISGEVLGDFIILSKLTLSHGEKDVAAVLACAALEDTLKRFAIRNGLDVSEKSMQEVVSVLKSKSLVGGAQKTLLDVMPKIRDYAMHANWDKITSQDVNSVIGFVDQFLLENFS